MIITGLKGYSNSNVYLMSENGTNFVRKYGDIDRNVNRYNNLNLPFPKILKVEKDYYDIEYIKNVNISTYLKLNSPTQLINFLSYVISYLSDKTELKDYTSIYNRKLFGINFSPFIFSKEQLISKLPSVLKSSKYFGDLTFDNILYDLNNNRFVLIDGLTCEYDSFIFDLHKLKQDVICKWFIRNEKDTYYIDNKLSLINNFLKQYEYYNNNYLTILMLLRVFPYCKNEIDRTFLIEEINRLWM